MYGSCQGLFHSRIGGMQAGTQSPQNQFTMYLNLSMFFASYEARPVQLRGRVLDAAARSMAGSKGHSVCHLSAGSASPFSELWRLQMMQPL